MDSSQSRRFCITVCKTIKRCQLATRDDRVKIAPVTKSSALVVGDPFLDGYVSQLPGAYAEAEMVSATLTANNFQPH